MQLTEEMRRKIERSVTDANWDDVEAFLTQAELMSLEEARLELEALASSGPWSPATIRACEIALEIVAEEVKRSE